MLSIAEQFAALLNAANFDEAAELLAEDCRYHYWEGDYAGRNNVINIYKQNHKHTTDTFDEVQYGSTVELMDGGVCRITFYDKIFLGDKSHEMKSHDDLTIANGLITDIHHKEIPGETEAFMAFWRSTRPAAPLQ
jgi:hypothetical protein